MRINNLHILNFRSFEEYDIRLAPEINVIIGRNGSGKTTLIHAMHKALSFIFASSKSLGKEFLSAGNPSLKVNSFDALDYHINSDSRLVADSATIHAEAIYAGHELVWDMYKRASSGAALYSSKYKNAFQTFIQAWRVGGANLPLLAYYSDSFPHRNIKETKFALDTIFLDKIPRNFGYYQWDMEGACTSIWETRLCNILAQMIPLYSQASRLSSQMLDIAKEETTIEGNANLKELSKERERIEKNIQPLRDEVQFIEKHFRHFVAQLPSLSEDGYVIDYFIPQQTGEGTQLCAVFKNGKSELLQDLPAGYRRLYSIVLDMAYRSYILNGQSEPNGIVMIDEVDLHLHPSLEQCIVQSLHDTFPSVQFILTTHSASVLSSLVTSKKNEQGIPLNKILYMQEGVASAQELPYIYGLDYNSVLRDFMGTPSRDNALKNKVDEYMTYCSCGLFDDADNVLKNIKELLGTDNHELLRDLDEKRRAYEVHR